MKSSMKARFVSVVVAVGMVLSVVGCTKEDSAVPESSEQTRGVSLGSDVIQEVRELESAEVHFSASQVPVYVPEKGTLLGTGSFALSGDVIGAVAKIDSRSTEEQVAQSEDASGDWLVNTQFEDCILLYMDQSGSVFKEVSLKETVSEEIYAVGGLYPRLGGGFSAMATVAYDAQKPYGKLLFFQMDADGKMVGELVVLEDDSERGVIRSSFARGIVGTNGMICVSGDETTEDEVSSSFVVVFNSEGEELFRVNDAIDRAADGSHLGWELLLSGDTIYVTGWDSTDVEFESWIAPVDVEAQKIGERIALNADTIVSGMLTEEGTLVVVDEEGISRVSLSEKTVERLILWENVNLDMTEQYSLPVLLLPDGRLFLQLDRRMEVEEQVEWFFLDKE